MNWHNAKRWGLDLVLWIVLASVVLLLVLVRESRAQNCSAPSGTCQAATFTSNAPDGGVAVQARGGRVSGIGNAVQGSDAVPLRQLQGLVPASGDGGLSCPLRVVGTSPATPMLVDCNGNAYVFHSVRTGSSATPINVVSDFADEGIASVNVQALGSETAGVTITGHCGYLDFREMFPDGGLGADSVYLESCDGGINSTVQIQAPSFAADAYTCNGGGAPSAGKVLTATGATGCTWSTPASGGTPMFTVSTVNMNPNVGANTVTLSQWLQKGSAHIHTGRGWIQVAGTNNAESFFCQVYNESTSTVVMNTASRPCDTAANQFACQASDGNEALNNGDVYALRLVNGCTGTTPLISFTITAQ